MKQFIFIITLWLSGSTLHAQPVEFDTYFAFEDASGRKDTAWYGVRLDATYDYDPKYEELAKQPIDSNTFVLLSNRYSSPKEFLNRKSYIKGEIAYPLHISFTFIDAAFPIIVKMDTAFIKNFGFFEKKYYKYFGTWCLDPYVNHPWNDVHSMFDCINTETGEFIINKPPSLNIPNEYCTASPITSEVEVIGKGKVTLNRFTIGTEWDTECKQDIISTSSLSPLGADAVIYPNPSAGLLSIETWLSSGIIRILDAQGMTVRMETIHKDVEKYSFTLEPGLYYAVIEQNGHRKAIGKIFVMK